MTISQGTNSKYTGQKAQPLENIEKYGHLIYKLTLYIRALRTGGEGGGKTPYIFADVFYGWPLGSFKKTRGKSECSSPHIFDL